MVNDVLWLGMEIVMCINLEGFFVHENIKDGVKLYQSAN